MTDITISDESLQKTLSASVLKLLSEQNKEEILSQAVFNFFKQEHGEWGCDGTRFNKLLEDVLLKIIEEKTREVLAEAGYIKKMTDFIREGIERALNDKTESIINRISTAVVQGVINPRSDY